MTTDEIKAIQKEVGTEPDGFWGAKSIAACQKYLRSLMPLPNPWPTADDASVTARFGKPGDESKLVGVNVRGLGVKYDGREVTTIRCHDEIADALLAVIVEISKGESAWVLGKYAGCFNHRPMRGGSRPSKHSWGIAIDLAPETNGLNDPWPTKANMPFEVMKSFARKGFISAGAFWGRDAMHMEATR